MITVRFIEGELTYFLSGYSDEEEYARHILSAMTGLSLEKLLHGEITGAELDLFEAAGRALQAMPLLVGPGPKPYLEVVK